MSDPRIASIAQALGGAPEELVERSAAARAAAQGVTLEEVLAAWSGSGEMALEEAPAAAPVASTTSEADQVASAPVEPVAQALVPAVAAVAVAVQDQEPQQDPVETADLGARIKIGAKIGAVAGGLLGLIGVVVTTPMMFERLSLPSGVATPAIEVSALSGTITIALLSMVFGAIVSLTCRGLARYVSEAFDVEGSSMSSVASGGFIGLMLGFVAGGIVIGTAEATLTSTKLLPVRSLVFTVLVGGVLLGAITGAIIQGIAQPATLRGEAASDAEVVKRRLGDSMLIPVGSFVIITVIVVSLGSLLVTYPGYAPVLAILVALGILAFASLMASRPNLRITRGEVMTAAAGVGIVLLMLALIAAQTSGGHGDEDDTHALVLQAL